MKISYTNLLSQISDETKNIDTSKILNAIGDDKELVKNIYHLVPCILVLVFKR